MHPTIRLVPFVLLSHFCSKYYTRNVLLLERRYSWGKYMILFVGNTKYYLLRRRKNCSCCCYSCFWYICKGIAILGRENAFVGTKSFITKADRRYLFFIQYVGKTVAKTQNTICVNLENAKCVLDFGRDELLSQPRCDLVRPPADTAQIRPSAK